MTPNKIAEDLVNQYRMILMNEDTDCGHEIICTVIAVKFATITIEKQIREIESFKMIYNNTSYCVKRITYLEKVLTEINKL